MSKKPKTHHARKATPPKGERPGKASPVDPKGRHAPTSDPKAPAPKAKPKASRTPSSAKERKPKRTSALDAAASVLAGASKPMNAKDLITEMAAQKLWTSPGGKTPSSTLYAAMIREIAAKGGQSRFKKVERGMFKANAQ
ncbi:MAG: winged helix-turn-helix domain-containing protein [Phycisphaerales bacterium]|nr:winged helix-turn-helix domain-containing protein [Phycisphaerales bacterium]